MVLFTAFWSSERKFIFFSLISQGFQVEKKNGKKCAFGSLKERKKLNNRRRRRRRRRRRQVRKRERLV